VLHRGYNCSIVQRMNGRIVRYGIIGSCRSAATSETVNRKLDRSLTHVKIAIASTSTFTFILTFDEVR